MTLSVAIMQPYFMPYAGYYRLFAATDLFVIYDCVQFPRRGWVHRNRFATNSGELDWLTLPLQKAPQQINIQSLVFAEDARHRLGDAAMRFPVLQQHRDHALMQEVLDIQGAPVTYLSRLLEKVCHELKLPFNTIRSSTLNIAASLRGQDRIIAIARAVGASRYVNASGGRALYNEADFTAQGMELRFLPDYKGNCASILEWMLQEPAQTVASAIKNQSVLSNLE